MHRSVRVIKKEKTKVYTPKHRVGARKKARTAFRRRIFKNEI